MCSAELVAAFRACQTLSNSLQQAVLALVRAGDIGNYVLFMLRMLTSCEIKSRADFFAPFILVGGGRGWGGGGGARGRGLGTTGAAQRPC